MDVQAKPTPTRGEAAKPAPRLALKIIKDAVHDLDGEAPQPQPRLRVLRTAFLPLNVYACIDIPLPAGESDPETSNEILSLHLTQPSSDGSKMQLVGVAGLPPPVRPATPRARHRRLLVLVSWPEASDGRYRLSLVRRGRHLGYVNLAKRTEQVRVLTKPPAAAPRYVRPVLISGTPKSGTTWLEKIINAHPDFLVLHEANTLRMLDGNVLARQLESQRAFYRTRFIPWMPVEYDAQDFARFLQISLAKELMAQLGRAWGASYVADRTPGYAALYPFVPDLWEDLRVVHIVRHPLDVITSWLFHEVNAGRDLSRPLHLPRTLINPLNERLDAGAQLGPGDYVSSDAVTEGAFNYFVRLWQREQDAALKAAERSPEQFHLIRYEDLSRDFAIVAEGVFRFFGTDPARTDIRKIEGSTSFRALSGGRDAGEENTRSFFRKGIVGDWRNVFSPEQVRQLWDPLAEAAVGFGYAID